MVYKAFDKNEIEVDRKEICRYASHKNADISIYGDILEQSIQSVLDAAEPKIIYEHIPVKAGSDNTIDFGSFKTVSRNLAKNLNGASAVIIFAATLGHKTERLFMKLRGDSAALLFADAAATAILESVADKAFDGIKKELASKGKYLRPRFSPGYGDFSLCHQKDIFRILDLERRMGMMLTENLFMLPCKSITALCAVVDSDENCQIGGCEICNKKDSCHFCRI